MKVSRAKERALMREFGLDETTLTEEEVAKRRQELKTLIKMGKTRGFLTHQEINDHLPEKLVDNEDPRSHRLDAQRHGHRGVRAGARCRHAADRRRHHHHATEEEAEEAAEAALSTVDSEFGRTTDPVRMYMREMGTVELLTREGEIEIAKRIEGGLQAMMLAISASPTTIAEILSMADKIGAGEMQISEAVDGFVSDDEADDYVAEEDFDEFDEEDDDDGQGGSKALTKKLEELKKQALEKFAAAACHFDKMRKAYEKDGYKSPPTTRPARHQRRPDDDPLHRQDHREAVPHPAQPGRRRAPLRARDPQDRGRQVRHAAGPLHQDLPAQRAEPEVGREGNRRRQALQRHAGAQPAAGAGTAAEADRPASRPWCRWKT
jgi:RNA polymerase primary sigma factor